MTDIAPFLNFLITNKITLVGNIIHAGMPGHVISELDNFLRMRVLGEIPEDRRYLAVMPAGMLARGVVAACPDHFSLPTDWASVLGPTLPIISDDQIFEQARQVCLFNPDMMVDVGVSSLKVALPDPQARAHAWPVGTNRGILWQVDNASDTRDQLAYTRRKAQTAHYRPWHGIRPLTPALVDFLGGQDRPLALVHIRYRREATNGGTLTAPEVLGPTLAFLRDAGYTVVKIGTEPYPEAFRPFGVLNYTDSGLQSFENDLLLFRAAAFAMINASGIESMPEVLGTPMLIYGRWQLCFLPAYTNCVVVPSLLRSRRTGRILTLAEQIRCYENRPEPWARKGNAGLHFPIDDFEERPPTAEEILDGAREAIALAAAGDADPELMRKRVPDLGEQYFRWSGSRIAAHFLSTYL